MVQGAFLFYGSWGAEQGHVELAVSLAAWRAMMDDIQ